MNKIVLEELKSNIKLTGNEYVIKNENNDVVFDIENSSSVIFNVFNEEDTKVYYTFNVLENSNLTINIFDAAREVKRNITINVNGENSSVILNLSCISLKENNYIVNVYHNSKNTHSKTNLHGLALDNNSIFIQNNGYIRNGSTKSTLNQDNKIIIMNDNNSKIEPNLYIDEYDTLASHGAYIGKFDEEELFYLNSRGLDNKSSYNLLINGFLLYEFVISDEDKVKLKNIIEKYWG
ncbi:MAG: SufD family Fe-S cluster assembly protein [Bacilli bacterium]|nr:SufD family Fe-S cluster assembly protein [Bacilli bacterium]